MRIKKFNEMNRVGFILVPTDLGIKSLLNSTFDKVSVSGKTHGSTPQSMGGYTLIINPDLSILEDIRLYGKDAVRDGFDDERLLDDLAEILEESTNDLENKGEVYVNGDSNDIRMVFSEDFDLNEIINNVKKSLQNED